MTPRNPFRLAGLLAGVAVLIATVVGITTSTASAMDLSPNCFVVIDGKVHINPACLTPTTGPTATPTMTVNLSARVNSLWVTAENAGAGALVNNRYGVGTWERFGLFMQSDGTVALKALINNRYVSASSGSLIASQTSVGTWERFTVLTNSDASVSLRAADGRLVVADPGGTQPLTTSASPTGLAASFDLVTAPVLLRTVGLRAHANSKFVSTSGGPLIANQTAIGATERFYLYQIAGGATALQAVSSGQYVTAENGGASPLIANRAGIGTWESFTVLNNSDGSISLRAAANLRLVTAENGGDSALIANRDGIGPWEEFDLVAA